MARYLDIHPDNPQPRLLAQVVQALQDDALVAYPTDSGYALGCRVGNRDGRDRILRIRGLDERHHFTLVCRDFSQLGQLVHVDNAAFRAIRACTPGPYTFILPATPEVPRRLLHPKKKTVGVRIPDPTLLEYAAARQVVLATPTTLIALLRTVAQGWAHERIADQAREIHRLGRDLHERLGTFGSHLDLVGRSLNAAVGHYNAAVGSYDHRVLVGARRFRDLAVTDDELPTPRQVTLRAVEGAGVETHGGTEDAADPALRRGSPEPPPRRSSVVS